MMAHGLVSFARCPTRAQGPNLIVRVLGWGVCFALCLGGAVSGFADGSSPAIQPGAGDLLNETFSHPTAPNWTNPQGIWNVVDGAWVRTDLSINPITQSVYVGPGAGAWTDYLLECDFRVLSPTRGNNEVSFYFRYQDDLNHYKLAFYYVNGGVKPQMQLIRLVNGTSVQLVPGMEWTIREGSHHVAVAVVAGRLDVFFDDDPIYNGADGSIPTGSVGVVSSLIEAAFDNVRVSSLPPNPPPRPPRPVVDAIDPYEGSFDQSVVIYGMNFGPSQAQAHGAVLFNSVPAVIETWSPSSIQVRAPEVDNEIVRVVAFDQISAEGQHRFDISPPTITSAEPSTTSAGDVVALKGEHFGFSPGQFGRVQVEGVTASIVSWTNDEVRFVMPDVATSRAQVVISTVAAQKSYASLTVLQPVGLSCQVAPSSVTLGQGLRISGVLTTRNELPLPSKTLYVGLVSPQGVYQPLEDLGAATTDAAGRYAVEVRPDRIPYPISQPGPWQGTAWYPQDEHYRDASVLSAPVEVGPVEARLVLEASPSEMVRLGRDVQVTGTLGLSPNTPAARTFVEGATVVVGLSGPGGQVYSWISRVAATAFSSPPVALTQVGPWRYYVRFEGTEAVLPAATTELVVQAVAELGYAIVVAGRVPTREGAYEHTRTTDSVVANMLASDFAPDSIVYLNSIGTSLPGMTPGAATKASVRETITQWAAGKMSAAPAPLYIVWVNHGDVVDGTGRFHLSDQWGEGADGYITPCELDTWLNQLEEQLSSGFPEGAPGPQIVFVLGACHSGSFIASLSHADKNRILVASSDTYEVSYRGPDDHAPRQGDYFVARFFDMAAQGFTLRESFRRASQEIFEYTRNRDRSLTNGRGQDRYSDGVDQHPQLDDNGDALSEADPLARDGDRARHLRLNGRSSDDDPGALRINGHREDLYLASGQSMPALYLSVANISQLARAWIEIRVPHSTPPPASLTESFQRDQGMPRFYNDPEDRGYYPDGGGIAWWTSEDLVGGGFDGFVAPGTYQIYYFVEDTSGRLSPVVGGWLFRDQAGNRPPESFSLLKPGMDETVDVYPCLQWEEAQDPDGGPVFYSVMLSQVPTFTPSSVELRHTGAETLLFAGRDLTLSDGTTYYWKVVARDAFGATRESREVFRFTTDTVNDVFGSMYVKVIDGSNGERISSASAALQPDAPLYRTSTAGSFIGLGLPVDSDYWLTVQAEGYRRPEGRQVVIRSADEPVVVEYFLYRPGDLDEDGRRGALDLFSLSAEWQRQPGGAADINQDGICDQADLMEWLDETQAAEAGRESR